MFLTFLWDPCLLEVLMSFNFIEVNEDNSAKVEHTGVKRQLSGHKGREYKTNLESSVNCLGEQTTNDSSLIYCK